MAAKLTNAQIHRYCLSLEEMIRASGKVYTSIYGVPMGGCPVAGMLAHMLDKPLYLTPEIGSLIVDDICDTGRTLASFPNNDKAVIACRKDTINKVQYYAMVADEWIVFPWEGSNVGSISNNIERIIQHIGEDIKREGLIGTPERVARSFEKLYGGYKESAHEILSTTFSTNNYDEMIVLRDVKFYSTCEHHMLPFFGTVNIGYIPDSRIIGISKLARAVEVYARRLQIQERMVQQIADAIEEAIQPRGVMVVAEGQHFCMTARGVEKQDAVMVTSSLKGLFKTQQETRNEFLSLIKKK